MQRADAVSTDSSGGTARMIKNLDGWTRRRTVERDLLNGLYKSDYRKRACLEPALVCFPCIPRLVLSSLST